MLTPSPTSYRHPRPHPHPQMELDGVEPDVISYNQALRACRTGADGSGRAAQLALELIAEVRSKGLGPDVVTLEGAARCVDRLLTVPLLLFSSLILFNI